MENLKKKLNKIQLDEMLASPSIEWETIYKWLNKNHVTDLIKGEKYVWVSSESLGEHLNIHPNEIIFENRDEEGDALWFNCAKEGGAVIIGIDDPGETNWFIEI